MKWFGLILAGILLVAQVPAARADDRLTADPGYRLLLKGYEAVRNQDLTAALRSFEAALRVTQHRALVLKELAYTHLKLRQREEAINYLHAALEMDPADRRVMLQYGFLAAGQGDRQTARQLFEQVRQQGDAEERATAEKALQNLSGDTSPQDPVYPILEVGYRALRTGDLPAAIEAFTQALALNPQRYRVRKDLAYALLKQGHKAAARADLAAVAEADPQDTQAALEAAYLSVELNDLATARKYFELARMNGDEHSRQRAEEALANLDKAPSADPTYVLAEKAYRLLAEKEYDESAEAFRQALELSPGKVSLYKDLAYLYLRVGENTAAREAFGKVMELDGQDFQSALEYAFLCYETRERALARRVFDRVRKEGDPVSRLTAEAAFQSIDTALARGIERWQKAVEANPRNFSVHEELAKLAEERDQLELAAEQYRIALEIRPDVRTLLLDLAQVYRKMGRQEEAAAWYLAASRSREARTAELARERLPDRHPYLGEFELALQLDSRNTDLRREYAFFLLELGEKGRARGELKLVANADPKDWLALTQLGLLEKEQNGLDSARPYLVRVMEGEDAALAEKARLALGLPPPGQGQPPPVAAAAEAPPPPARSNARELGFKSYESGYLTDAERYLQQAWEENPQDWAVALQLGWTYNVMEKNSEAVRWFALARQSPDPQIAARAAQAHAVLTAAAQPPPGPPVSPLPAPDSAAVRELALKSFDAGYLADAERYLKAAYEQNPQDYEAALKLGFTYNMQQRNAEAINWFRIAQRSPEKSVATDARKAYRSLTGANNRLQTTTWMFPLFSTRWNSGFAYAQIKTELKLKKLPLYPYLSARFVGDSQSVAGGPYMPYLSETSVILGVGLRTTVWKGLMGWAEAGSAIKYLQRSDVGAMVPDYRAGLAFFRVYGRGLGAERAGRFYETNFDSLYASRFDNNLLFIDQNRLGYTFPPIEELGSLQLQVLWNTNITMDVKRQAWANFLEFGPGVQFRMKNWPAPLRFSVHGLRGVYLKNQGNPYRPNFNDLRLGMWYAFSR